MTGLGAYNNSFLFVSSRSQNSAFRYTAPGISSRHLYLKYAGGSQTRDIAMTPDGYVWVATDWTSIPLRLYNTDDQMIDSIDDSVLPPLARGVTLDDEGYLWVSNVTNDKIYKIDLTEGMEEGEQSPARVVSASANPFSGQVTITGHGYGSEATITISDVSGRTLVDEQFDGSYVFDGPGEISRGIYFVTIRNGGCSVSTLKLTAL